nr:FHA domain-containing protein [Actinomycetota bacterium]
AEVQSGRAAPIVLTDPQRKISRSHAYVVLDGWDVKVVDRHSANGTFVEYPEEPTWRRLVREEAVTLRPGTRVRVGNRTLVFDSHYKA